MAEKLKAWSTQAWTSPAPVEALRSLAASTSGYMLFQVRQLGRMNDNSWGETLTN